MINNLQKPVVTAINAVEPYIQKVDEKVRNIITEICFFIIAAAFFISRMGEKIPGLSDFGSAYRNKIIIAAFFAAMLFSIKGRVEALKCRLPMLAAWGLFCTAATVSFIVHYRDLGYLTLGLIWVLFPMCCFIWANRGDYEHLFKMVCRPFSAVFLCNSIFVLYLMIFDTDRYKIYEFGYRLRATTMHPNYFGMLTAAGGICCAYMLLASKKTAERIVYGIGVGLAGAFLMLASSRTSLLAIAAAMAMVIVYALFRKNRAFVLKSAALLMVLVISIGVGGAASKAIIKKMTEEIKAEAVVDEQIPDNDKEESTSDSDSGESKPQAESKPDKAETAQLEKYLSEADKRLNPFGQSLNKLTSGRVSVWKGFLNHLNLTGEHWGQREVEIRKEIKAELGYEAFHAHNQYLQTAHKMGIFAGIFELAVSVIAVVFLIKAIIKKEKLQPWIPFSIIAVCSFCLISIMEIIGDPFSRELSFLYLISLVPMFFEKQEKLSEHNRESAE